eukprot:gene14705-5802_t
MLNGDVVDDDAMSADKAEELFKARPQPFYGECSQSAQDGVFEDQEIEMEVQFRSAHSIDFKFFISELALKYNNKSIADAFNISVKQVKEWRRQNLLLKQAYYEKNVAAKVTKDKPDLSFTDQNISACSTLTSSVYSSSVTAVPQPTMSEAINSNSTPKPRKKSSYSSEYKLKAVAYAEVTTNRAAAREFNVHEKRIREWRKNKEVLMNSPKDCRRLKGAGRKPFVNQQLEEKLYNWLIVTAKERTSISKTDLKQKAIEINLTQSLNTKFTANDSWVDGFLRRHNLNLKMNECSSSSSDNKSCQSNISETYPLPTMIRNEQDPFDSVETRYSLVSCPEAQQEENTNDDSSRSIPYSKLQ